MLASELIKNLSETIEIDGDTDVLIVSGEKYEAAGFVVNTNGSIVFVPESSLEEK